MKNTIIKILKESEFDWIKSVPSFIEITEPVTVKNPKDKYRLYWSNGTGEEYGTWSDNWANFNNDSNGVESLTRYCRILTNGVNSGGFFSVNRIVDLYLEGHHDYIVTNWMRGGLAKIPEDADTEEERDSLTEWLEQDLYDMGILFHDHHQGNYATVERWWVNYFDKNGVEFKTKVSIV